MVSRKVLISSFVMACLLFSPPALADSSFNWDTQTYGGTGSWSDPDHWSPKGIPGGLDPSNTFVTINAPQTGLEASEVNLSGDVSINSLSIGPKSPSAFPWVGENSLNIGNMGYLTFLGSEANPKPQINNAGIINLRGKLSTGNSELDWTEIKGAGKILMLGAGDHFSGHLQNRQTIEGQGNIGGFMSNQGTIRASNGYVLKLYASIFNEGGVLTTDGFSDPVLKSELFIGADIEKGVIDANGALVHFVTSGPIKDVTLTGGQMVFGAPPLRLSGAITINPDVVLSSTTGTIVGNIELQLQDKTTLVNNGVVRFVDGAAGALKLPDKSNSEGSNATLTGSGRLVLNWGGQNSGGDKGLDIGPNSWLVHEADHTIEGSGSVLGGSITNKGRIIARDGTLRVAASIANAGTMEASPGGILELMGGSVFKGSGDPSTLSPGGGIIRLSGATVANGERVISIPLWRTGAPSSLKTGSSLSASL